MSTTTERSAVITLHVANTETGEYDVRKPLPYPFHLDLNGYVTRQDFWRGEPIKLLGFQAEADRHEIDLVVDDWLPTAGTPCANSQITDPIGMWPVFLDADGSIWTHRFPADKVTRIGADR